MLFNRSQPDTSNAIDDSSSFREAILKELLRQVHHSYNLALAVTAASSLMTLAGVGLLYLNQIPAASITTAVGALASISSIQFAKESQDKLRKMIKLSEESE